MEPHMKRTYSQIDLDERRKIERWRQAGVSVDTIAEKLGRHRSTIFRESAQQVRGSGDAGSDRLFLRGSQ
jgi:IS30 family transposase